MFPSGYCMISALFTGKFLKNWLCSLHIPTSHLLLNSMQCEFFHSAISLKLLIKVSNDLHDARVTICFLPSSYPTIQYNQPLLLF